MKIAHIADTHIKNLKYHEDYRACFEQMYEILRQQEVDYIVHCGDIAHTKTQISPEFVEMASGFFGSLASIAPTYIILGNHDGNLKNSSRQDAITPIVQALDNSAIHRLKNAGEVVVDDLLTLNVLSVFDRDNWIDPGDPSKINIALYHGSISNCQTDAGWTLEHGEDNLSIFEEFDFAMLVIFTSDSSWTRSSVFTTQALLFSKTTVKKTIRDSLSGQSILKTIGPLSILLYKIHDRLLL